MSTDPTKPSAEERAALIVGRLGKLVGMAMNMDGAGAGIALSKQQEQIEKEIRAAEAAAREPLIAENRILRGLVQTNPDWKCPHGETVDNIGKCPSGFPGCACADDRISVLCEDEERIVSGLRAEVERLKENLKTASAQTARRPPLNRNRRDMIEAARAEGRREGLEEAAKVIEGMEANYPTDVWPEIDMRGWKDNNTRRVAERNAAGMARQVSKSWAAAIRAKLDGEETG